MRLDSIFRAKLIARLAAVSISNAMRLVFLEFFSLCEAAASILKEISATKLSWELASKTFPIVQIGWFG